MDCGYDVNSHDPLLRRLLVHVAGVLGPLAPQANQEHKTAVSLSIVKRAEKCKLKSQFLNSVVITLEWLKPNKRKEGFKNPTFSR